MRQHGGEQSGLVTLTFDLESDVRVTCDVGYLCANFGLPRPLCSRLRPDVRDRQTDVRQHHRLMPLPIRGGRIITHFRVVLFYKQYVRPQVITTSHAAESFSCFIILMSLHLVFLTVCRYSKSSA